MCAPQCGAKECGPDGCGGSCGDCDGNDVCAWDGFCYGSCEPGDVSFSDTVQKLNYMAVGYGGHPGEALDVDADANTCSPYNDCEKGLDNQLSGLFAQLSQFIDVNAQIQQALESGSLIMLAEMVAADFNGNPFVLNMFIADAQNPKPVCNYQNSKCEYLVASDSIDLDACQPFVTFDNAKVVSDVLKAGGLGYQLKLLLPLFPGFPIAFDVFHARIVADLLWGPDGSLQLSGLIGGGIPKESIMDAVDLLPDDGLPVSKDMIKNLLDMFIKNDIDTNGDGEKNAASIGIKFGSIEGIIVGVF